MPHRDRTEGLAVSADVTYRWVSHARQYGPSHYHRHLLAVHPKAVTTLCGTTGLGGVWRGDTRKPVCDGCVQRATDYGVTIKGASA